MKVINATRSLILTMTLLLMCHVSQAQKYESISPEQVKTLKMYAAQKVGQLNDYISFMANKQEPNENKKYYKKSALDLFVEKGEPFIEIIEFADGSKKKIDREGVVMETATIRNRKPRKRLMKTYFDDLIGDPAQQIIIQSTDIADMRVSQLEAYGDGRYICSVYFDQAYIKKYKDGHVYKDITRKWVVCYVDRHITTDSTEAEYVVTLGDIHVESVSNM